MSSDKQLHRHTAIRGTHMQKRTSSAVWVWFWLTRGHSRQGSEMISESLMTDCTVRQSGRLSHHAAWQNSASNTNMDRQTDGRLTETHTQTDTHTAPTLISINKHLWFFCRFCVKQTQTPVPLNPHLATSKLSSESSVDTSYTQIHKLTPHKPKTHNQHETYWTL